MNRGKVAVVLLTMTSAPSTRFENIDASAGMLETELNTYSRKWLRYKRQRTTAEGDARDGIGSLAHRMQSVNYGFHCCQKPQCAQTVVAMSFLLRSAVVLAAARTNIRPEAELERPIIGDFHSL